MGSFRDLNIYSAVRFFVVFLATEMWSDELAQVEKSFDSPYNPTLFLSKNSVILFYEGDSQQLPSCITTFKCTILG